MRYLDVPDVLELSAFACQGREMGVREMGLLASAAHRPRSEMFGVEAFEGRFGKAAALLHALAGNHPFVDGNKRTAWMSTVVFLDLHGLDMAAVDQQEAYRLVVEVASGELADVTEIALRLRRLYERAEAA
ncbi:type II toxin-antitoxin system death-on-curing family toxin [Kitasatospora sp. NPDC048540]|uniref:type II toxin-antitoxin system death-on-curing family toxin n=1 Tax=unclassified Kitasatospora TaxID=2633591 RepID=UPI00053B3927|nr:type II toxin-antitoxin system death-on-curing family toxin [Kitasatospora sp. MBT63]